MIGVELVSDHEDRTPDPEAFNHIHRFCLERDLIIIDCGPDGNVIRYIPSLVTSTEELDWSHRSDRRGAQRLREPLTRNRTRNRPLRA